MSAEPEPCGAWMVTRRVEGLEAETQWCGRRNGPCSFPGAVQSIDNPGSRRCGALPGKQLFLTYGEDGMKSAVEVLEAMLSEQVDGPGQWQAMCVAIDAIRTCIGEPA